MATLLPLKRQSVAMAVYAVLKEHILSGAFPPGTQLDTRALQQQLGVSQTPLKVAIHRLESDGLVRVVPQRGTFVAAPSETELREAFEVRLALELHAITLLMEVVTDPQLETLVGIVRELRQL